ncbi:nucleoside hydrolase-like [Dermacentor albipictus]|uniref:nucleoside hydrolase-like n=1 Tax=Dermacentor albipictus TaxID=60249 RepID=UPI0038FC4868
MPSSKTRRRDFCSSSETWLAGNAALVLMWTSIRLACAALFLAGNAGAVLSSGRNDGDPYLRLLLDVDPGVDDALAITLAARLHENVRLEAITVVAGNADLQTGYNNTLRTLNVLDRRDVPVYKGADRPIDGHGRTEKTYFGPDNFGGVSAKYPMSRNPAADPHIPGYIKMIQAVKYNPGQLTLVLMAPLTNLAIALLVAPEISAGIRHVYILGGTLYGKGNASPTAEFNFFTDPEAAFVVLQRATCPITIVPWEAILQATVPWDTYYSITNKSGRIQKFLRDTTAYTVQCCLSGGQSPGGFSVGDFLAVLAAAVPESVAQTLQHRVNVERCGAYTRGQLVHAWEPKILPQVKRNVTIVESFDVGVVEKYFKYTFDPTGA